MKFLADEDFPKVPTSNIIPLIENFLKYLEQTKLSKGKVLKFSKSGLEELKLFHPQGGIR